ncbi:hypothetical protein M8998_02290 [Sphingobacterium sp. lm-10]|uniref:hypothetical protein n=1 Tax=Sphingobacterium sp. lm-10 TaxID=2944904 RepID=UPI002020B4FB|nr:hypothetical protein [Sphingobacterium sp. lm-10]MCL7986762.1 hypothetical protein [Sphingobacterium sp. lm-10]
MSTQDNANKDPKLTEDKDPKKQTEQEHTESGKGDGYVPPTPEAPSAHNAREHNGPITNKNPGGRRE